MKRHFTVSAVVLLFAIFLLSCTNKYEATIQSDGSGSVDFHLQMEEYFFDSILEMSDLSEKSEGLAEGEIFNISEMKKSFAENPAITLEKLKSPQPEILNGSFSFNDIESVFSQEEKLQSARIVRFSQDGEEKKISVHIEKENFAQVANLLPILDDPYFNMFSPLENKDVTDEEYIQMIEFAFGKKGAKGVQTKTIDVTVHVDGTLVSQTGGKVEGNNAVFEIPLFKALRLNEPLDYSIVFR